MAKEVTGFVKLQVKGGQANPSPPIGPALGAKGINIMDFCKRFNDQTKDRMGTLLPVVISVYADKSFDFIIKTPPASSQLLKVANLKSGSKVPNRDKVATINWDKVKTIAEDKMQDLNCFKIDSAMRIIAGTARSMGINVDGTPPWESKS